MAPTWLAVLSVVCCQQLMVQGEDVKEMKKCTSDANVTFNLACKNNEMMYYMHSKLQDMTDDCKPGGDCNFQHSVSTDTDCVGVSACNKTVRKSWYEDGCNKTGFFQPTLLYECIPETPVDICGEAGLAAGADKYVYLKSPYYPEKVSSPYPNRTCTCDIRGSEMRLQILEAKILARSNDTKKYTMTAGFTVYPNDREVNTVTGHIFSGVLPFTARELKDVKHVRLVYNAGGKEGKDDNYLWMRVKGKSAVTVACNGAPEPSTPAPDPTNKVAPTYSGYHQLTVASLVAVVTAIVLFGAA
ncbi:uncharacterized protein LOC124260920 [Haliotis rubra]|uniref:uncharacterized protein LOC124260920 n=1 Tax=Haliotis rubra TaxID=36100 RepID=UPI001EE51040|nr:uncharacterized protein LOC124260920 [Haliotis rubra]